MPDVTNAHDIVQAITRIGTDNLDPVATIFTVDPESRAARGIAGAAEALATTELMRLRRDRDYGPEGRRAHRHRPVYDFELRSDRHDSPAYRTLKAAADRAAERERFR